MIQTNLTGTQFRLILPYLPKVKQTRPRKYSLYDILNGILYVLRTGCQWRELPKTYPNWHSAYKYFRKLTLGKYLDLILFKLNSRIWKCVGQFDHKQQLSHILVTDSQSIKDTELERRSKKGYDGHKHVKGLKRFSLVDVFGYLWAIHTLPANISEKDGLRKLLAKYQYILPRQFTSILADKGFESKRLTQELGCMGYTLYAMRSTKRLKKQTPYDLEQNNLHNYLNKQISKLRWVVERTFSWLQKCRRLVINWERQAKMHEGFAPISYDLTIGQEIRVKDILQGQCN